MNQLLPFLLALAPQEAPTQASYHPAYADLYVEVPDVPALLSQYESAAMVRSFRNESVRGLLAGLEVDFRVEPKALVGQLLSTTLAGSKADAGAWVESVRSFSASFGVPQGGEPAVQGVIHFVSDAKAQEAVDWMKAAATTSGDHAVDGVVSLQFAQFPETSFWAAAKGNTLVYGGGAIQPAEARETTLADQADLTSACKALADDQGVTLAWIGLRRSPFDVIRDLPEAMTAEYMPIVDGIRSSPIPLGFLEREHWVRMKLDQGRFVTEMVGAPASSTPGVPVEPGWLDTVPDEAMFLYASAFDGAGFADTLRGLLSMEPGAAQSLAKVEEEVGHTLEGLLSQMGPSLVTYGFPIAGIGVPQTYFMVELQNAEGSSDDPQAFSARLASLIDGFGQVVPGLSTKSRDYRVKTPGGDRVSFPLTTINLPPEIGQIGGMLSVSPAFTVADGKVLFSLTSLHLKRELKRLYGNEREPSRPLAARGLVFPEDPGSVLVMDWGMLIDGVFELARAAGAMMGDSLPFSMSDLPKPEVFTGELRPTLHFTRTLAGGASYRRMESSFGPELILAALGQTSTTQEVAETPEPDPVEVAELEAADVLRQRRQDTSDGFRSVRSALTVYRLEHQRFPDKLADLTQPTDSFPQGFLDGGDVPVDGWKRDFHYALQGKGYVLYSLGPNGKDDGGQGDDIAP